MREEVLLDTGPLVAYLNRRGADHDWARAQWQQIRPPLLTNEAVISEACFLLSEYGGDPDSVLKLIEREVIRPSFKADDHVSAIRKLIRKYRKSPMSFTDACLVRMSELHTGSLVFTLDGDFRVYRHHGRQVIPLLAPVSAA